MELEERIVMLTKEGWEIVHRSEEGVQLRKPRQWKQKGIVLFVLIPFLVGFVWSGAWTLMLVGLVIVVLDYLMQKPKMEYISRELE